jgi:hypothetical protein
MTLEFRTYLEGVTTGQERIALRNADLLAFILMKKGEKRQELARIIGYEALDNFRATIQQTQFRLEKDGEYIAAKQNYSTLQNDILKLTGTMIATEAELWKSAREIATKLGAPLQIVDDASYTVSIQAIRSQLGKQEKGQQKLRLSQVKQQLGKIQKTIEGAALAYSEFQETYSKLVASEETLRQIRLLGLLSGGRTVVGQKLFDLNVCPLCLQPKSHEDLLKELQARIAKLEEGKKLQEEATRVRGSALGALATAKQAAKDAADKLTEFGIPSELTGKLNTYGSSVDAAIGDIHQYFDSYQPVSSNIGPDSATLSNALPEEISRFDEQVTQLEVSQEEQKLIDLIQSLENLRAAFRKLTQSSQTKAAYERQIRTLETIKAKFSTVHTNTLQQALNMMSKHIGEYYLAMHPNEQVDDIKLTILEEGVEFQYAFQGKPTYPPIKYLSESHLNSLGIAAFLASARLFNKTNQFFVLDDVVTSFDANHRLRLLRLLKDQFSGWQILLLTHEPVWFELIKKELLPAGWLVREVELLQGAGIRLKVCAKDTKEAVAQKKAAGTLVPNEVRTLLERILKELCYHLEVKVAFRFDEENERRMPGELLSELRSTLKRKSPNLKEHPALSRVETSSLIGTIGSHDSGPVIAPADLAVALEDVVTFDGLFCCAACGAYVAVEHYVPHEKKIYCKCGKKSMDWKD